MIKGRHREKAREDLAVLLQTYSRLETSLLRIRKCWKYVYIKQLIAFTLNIFHYKKEI